MTYVHPRWLYRQTTADGDVTYGTGSVKRSRPLDQPDEHVLLGVGVFSRTDWPGRTDDWSAFEEHVEAAAVHVKWFDEPLQVTPGDG